MALGAESCVVRDRYSDQECRKYQGSDMDSDYDLSGNHCDQSLEVHIG